MIGIRPVYYRIRSTKGLESSLVTRHKTTHSVVNRTRTQIMECNATSNFKINFLLPLKLFPLLWWSANYKKTRSGESAAAWICRLIWLERKSLLTRWNPQPPPTWSEHDHDGRIWKGLQGNACVWFGRRVPLSMYQWPSCPYVSAQQ